MRLSVQGCLILLLCCFTLAFPTLAAADLRSGLKKYVQNCKGGSYDYGDPIATWVAQMETEGYVQVWANEGMDGNCWTGSGGVCPVSHPYYTGDKDQYGQPVCSSETPSCPDGEEYNPDTAQCEVITAEPEECYENGEIYDAQNQQCVQSCPEGELNGVCLEEPAVNDDSCNADSPDYQGFIGNGNTKVNLCESNRQCDGGAFGVVNGTPACIPDEYGPPTCKVETVAVIDEYGFVCADPQDAPEPGQEPDEWWKDEEPNTDTDSDGEPDEYDPGNDPTSVDKGLDKINKGIAEGNENSKGTNDRLDKIGKGIAKSNELQDEANGVADDARDTLKEINEKLDGPEDGYDTSGLGEAATFGDTATRLQNAISNHPTIQAVTHIPSVASNYTCPTWTIPSNDYFGPLTFDTHCAVFNDYRGQLSILFILVWTLSAVMIFLRA